VSQNIALEVAKTLKRGDTLYHNIIEFGLVEGEKTPATATVRGRVKIVPGVEGYRLPIHQNYGAEVDTDMTKFGAGLWRTTPEKIVPARLHRTRSASTHTIPEEPASDSEAPPVARVRRTRTTATCRIVDDNATLLQNAQDQLHSLRVRRRRS
jgi:hypothetical protein